MRSRTLQAILLAFVLVAGTATANGQAAAEDADISVRLSGTRIYFEADPDYYNFTVRVTGPNDFLGEVYSMRRPPSVRLGDYGTVEDGVYRYEISAATQEVRSAASRRSSLDNGRSPTAQQPRVGVSTGGSFRVINGQILVSSETESET